MANNQKYGNKALGWGRNASITLACVAGAKRGRGGGERKGKGKGAPALKAYVFA